jgi:hypothetical protein
MSPVASRRRKHNRSDFWYGMQNSTQLNHVLRKTRMQLNFNLPRAHAARNSFYGSTHSFVLARAHKFIFSAKSGRLFHRARLSSGHIKGSLNWLSLKSPRTFDNFEHNFKGAFSRETLAALINPWFWERLCLAKHFYISMPSGFLLKISARSLILVWEQSIRWSFRSVSSLVSVWSGEMAFSLCLPQLNACNAISPSLPSSFYDLCSWSDAMLAEIFGAHFRL